MIGKAWQSLASEFEEELHRSDPNARVNAAIDASGLLHLRVVTDKRHRAAARTLARAYEARASVMCETCGGSMKTVGAGFVLSVLCPDCKSH